ncbi:4'-phosphopantetheinyl transferase superfamily protein [uncultured Sulfitobacter sp.]|uniref:4'-phosphopantetheinyl transferase family protein n=1 Tax=uncultured Sulfitobacter sp. TaxID=191468 RepID=UPI002624A6A7|nr:4'-phosphopantetheinyl transferase superfamily protein [uncultured Sulfitobacter sp.]
MNPDPALVAALTTAVLPPGLGVAAGDLTSVPPQPYPAEAGAVRDAIPARIVEFHTGRTAARAAMRAISLPEQPVLMAQTRAPIWPDGMTGSISHSKTACVAVVGKSCEWAGIGVDLEEATALDALLIAEVCTKAERLWLGTQPEHERGLMAKLIFSAKEACYKAQYPVTGLLFGFDVLELAIDRKGSHFEASFCTAQGPFNTGEILHGRFAHAAGLLVTGVAIRHSGNTRILNG